MTANISEKKPAKLSGKPLRPLYEQVYREKFSFGENWKRFLGELTEQKLSYAKKSLVSFIDLKSLKNKVFIDAGCGSGLYSLAAIRLSAKKVISFDVDFNSVNCAKYLREKHKIGNKRWEIRAGSLLNKKFLKRLGKADIVYSWGVAHHTGKMHDALENLGLMVKNKGILYLAIYNNFQGFPLSSKNWLKIKKFYADSPGTLRKCMELAYCSYYGLGLTLALKNPFRYMSEYGKNNRGMSFYRDACDWLGGYPYEYASIREITDFFEKRNFKVLKVKPTKREGCNEYLFLRKA
jgi:2-polyprenyl-3-methyl-5-hydroxy-6-metoxy-1,4-benzoquinol methylase